MTVINRDLIDLSVLMSQAGDLVRISGLFMGVPMTEDPELPCVWDPLNIREQAVTIKELMGFYCSIDTFSSKYYIYTSYRDEGNRVNTTVSCPYDTNPGVNTGEFRSYSKEALSLNKALCYLYILREYLKLDFDERYNPSSDEILTARRGLEIDKRGFIYA